MRTETLRSRPYHSYNARQDGTGPENNKYLSPLQRLKILKQETSAQMADPVNIKTQKVVQMQDEDFESSQDSTPKVLRSDLATRLANK